MNIYVYRNTNVKVCILILNYKKQYLLFRIINSSLKIQISTSSRSDLVIQIK